MPRWRARGGGTGRAGIEQVAVIADVHADWPALSAVAGQIEGLGIDRVVCLGDWASGGPDPARCFDWVISRCEIVLAGNHELFVLGRAWEHETASWALAAEQAHAELGPGRVARLRDFDAYARTPYAELVHGALTNPISDLITTPAAAAQNLRLLDAPVLLYAHSHQAAHWQTPDASDRPRRRQPRLEVPVTLDPAHLALLNPGAVTHDHRWLQLQLDDGRPTTATWRKAPATPAA